MIFVITAMVRPVQAGHFNSSGSGYGHFVLDGNEKLIGHSTLGYYQPWNSYYFDTATMEMGAYNESTDEQTLTIRYYITHYGSNYCWADLPGVVRVDGKTVATFKGWWYNPNNEAAKRISNTTILYGETTVKLKAPGTYKIEVGNVGTGDNNTISISVGASIAIDLPTYTVTFVDGLGSTLKTQKVTKYQNATPPSSPSRTGYTFAGWSGTYTSVTSNRTITATWSPNTYYVYYNANGGSNAPSTTSFKFNSGTGISSSQPTRTGYTFTGWNTAANGTGTSFSPGQAVPGGWGSFTLYAQWKINAYTNYVSHWTWGYKNGEGNNGGKTAFHLGDTSFSANYGSTYTMDSSRKTTIPNGFYLSSSFGTAGITGSWAGYSMPRSVTQNAYGMTFEYDYYPYDYTITYNLNGGTNNSANPSSYNVLYGVSLKDPSRTGYTFTGWYDGNTKITGINEGKNASFTSASDMYNQLASRTTGNKTLTAKWEPITYTVVYNGNGNTGGSTASSTHTYDVAKNLTANGFIKTGYSFAGWNTKADGSGTSYADKASVKNLTATDGGTVTLYAQWSANQYSVSYNANGGTGTMSPDTATYGQPFTVKDNQFSRPGYKFVCWNEKSDGTGTSWNGWIGKPWIWTYTKNITLYAQWNVIPPTISAKKGFFYQDSVVTQADLRAYATAHDIVEGNISHKIIIDAVILPNGTKLSKPSSFTASILGDYTVKYTVENERGASASVDNIVTVVERGSSMIGESDKASIYSRYISNEVLVDGNNALDTLESKSIWRTSEYSQKLNQALNNSTPLSGYEYVNESTFKQNARRR